MKKENDLFKILKVENGIEVLQGSNIWKLDGVSYEKFTLGQFNQIRTKLLGRVNEKENADTNEIIAFKRGNKLIFSDQCCENCLKLQYPLFKEEIMEGELEEYKISNMVVCYDNEKVIERKKIKISHASCCPIEIKKIDNSMMSNEEITVDEGYLNKDIFSNVIIDYSFIYTGCWKMKCYFIKNGYKVFVSTSKSLVIEKLLQYVLKHFFNYEKFGIGFNLKSALCDYKAFGMEHDDAKIYSDYMSLYYNFILVGE